MEQQKGLVMALDISTSNIGLAMFDEVGEFLSVKHIAMDVDKDVKVENRYLPKANIFKEFIQEYKSKNIIAIIIEDPLGSSNNIFTANLLIKFNGILSYILHQELNVIPQYVTVHNWRKELCPEFVRIDRNRKGEIKKEVFSIPKEIDKKDYVFEKIKEKYPQISWLVNKKGVPSKENYDMADSIGVGLYYFSELKK